MEKDQEMYDRSVRLYNEGYPPEILEQKLKKGDLHKGTFMNERFHNSHFLQMKTLHELNIKSVLEIGPGECVAAMYLKTLGIDYHTMDSYEGNSPTIHESIEILNPDKYANKYEAVCAFQCLEHLPYSIFQENIAKMAVMSTKYVVISLPFHCGGINFSFNIAMGQMFRIKKTFSFYLPLYRKNRKYRQEYMDEFPWAVHYWEIGRKGFPLNKICNDVESANLKIINRFHSDNPYHYFIVAEKK